MLLFLLLFYYFFHIQLREVVGLAPKLLCDTVPCSSIKNFRALLPCALLLVLVLVALLVVLLLVGN